MSSRIVKCYKVVSRNYVSFKTIENIIIDRSQKSINIDIKYNKFDVRSKIICYNLYKNQHKFIESYCKDILKTHE